VRQRELRAALTSSLRALKATGIGIVVEFAMVCQAGFAWVVGVVIHFAF